MGLKEILSLILCTAMYMAFVINQSTPIADGVIIRDTLDLPSIVQLLEDEINSIQTEKRIEELLTMRERLIEEEKERLLNEEQQKTIARSENKQISNKATRGAGYRDILFNVSCYDLSVQSTGKPIGHEHYGLTASGFNLTGHTWETARLIAVDPKIIPMGSIVKLTFTDERYSKYNGEYIAGDKGGAIKGYKIDFFMGDFQQNEPHQSALEFGRTKATIEIVKQFK